MTAFCGPYHYCVLGILIIVGFCMAQDDPCANINNCGQCIRAHPSCSWCIANNTQQRCKTEQENLAKCPNASIVNPRSHKANTTDEPFTVIDQEVFYNSTNVTVLQLKPQLIDLHLRPGQKQTVDITFKKVVDYPLDLYYVMDLSNSMKDDLNKLKTLGNGLVKEIKAQVTKNIQLGFGSFVDKVMMPYASTVAQQLIDPCSTTNNNDSCAPVFGFRHQLPITSEEASFIKAVQSTNISGNIDSPEGGFDALMQIAVCQDIINWRKEALHVILFTTDASPHIALDGKLAAILEANDMQCHLEKGAHPYLEDAVVYSKSKYLDYPSIGQLKQAFNTYKIQTIFAVTNNVHSLYKDLPKLMDNSFVGILESDSSNVVRVISKSYDELKSKIQLSVPNHPDNIVMSYRVRCPGNSTWKENTLVCNNISIDDQVVFQFDFTAESCPSDPSKTDSITVTSNSLKDEVKINIHYVCDCDCAKNPIVNSSMCNGYGNLECGVCACSPGRLGRQCQCSPSKSEIPLEANCTESGKSTSEPLCNSNGFCECGDCLCNEGFFGDFCECKSTGCSLDNKGQLCGGIDKGDCINCNDNPVCQCKISDGWTINANTRVCSCNNKTCQETPESPQCSKNGVCNCDKCTCDKYYDGLYCQDCFHPNCKGVDVSCNGQEARDCADCVYAAGRVNQPISVRCAETCPTTKFQPKPTSMLPSCKYGCTDEKCEACLEESDIPETSTCEITDSTGCKVRYRAMWIDDFKSYILFVKTYNHEEDCPKPIDPLLIVLPVVGGIVLIGLIALIIWKIYQTLRDKQEYESFMEETRQKKWTQGVNPIFSKASVRIENPAYMGGKY